MASNNISSQPIWYTEGSWGIETNTNVMAMTTDDRTAYLAQDYLFLWGESVARYYWYSWDATDWGTLWTASGGVNPTGLAYGQLYSWLVGSTADSTNALVQGSDGSTWTASLTLSNNDQAEIVWNATTTKTITLGTNFTYYQTLDTNTRNIIVSNMVTIGNKPILIVAPQPINLAEGQPVTVSSTSGSSFAGSNAVDGDLTTRWSSAYADSNWIYVDLGQVTPLSGVTLFWQVAYASQYKIQVSTDATNWTDVYTNLSGVGGTERIKFSASGRYVKMLGIHRGTVWGYSLWEFQVFGANRALHQPVTVSSSSGLGFVGTNAVDGNLNTRWSSAYTSNEWIYVDLGATTSVNEVSLVWQGAYATQYKIQVSSNASVWTDVYTNTNGVGGFERFSGSASGRYVRMLGIQRATSFGYSLWEFQIYGF